MVTNESVRRGLLDQTARRLEGLNDLGVQKAIEFIELLELNNFGRSSGVATGRVIAFPRRADGQGAAVRESGISEPGSNALTADNFWAAMELAHGTARRPRCVRAAGVSPARSSTRREAEPAETAIPSGGFSWVQEAGGETAQAPPPPPNQDLGERS